MANPVAWFLPSSQSRLDKCTTGMPAGKGSTGLWTDIRSRSAPTQITRSNGASSVRAVSWRRVRSPRNAGCPVSKRALYGTGSWNTPAPRSSASRASSAKAAPAATSRPAMITGRCAASSRCASGSSTASTGRTRCSTRVGRPRSSAALASMMSPGRLRNTGPIGAVSATLAARCTIRGRSSSRGTSTAHLTSGCAIRTRGSYSIGSCRPWPVSCWPAVTSTGEPANFAL